MNLIYNYFLFLLSPIWIGLGLDADLLYQILFYLWIVIRNKESPGVLFYIQVMSLLEGSSAFLYIYFPSAPACLSLPLLIFPGSPFFFFFLLSFLIP